MLVLTAANQVAPTNVIILSL